MKQFHVKGQKRARIRELNEIVVLSVLSVQNVHQDADDNRILATL